MRGADALLRKGRYTVIQVTFRARGTKRYACVLLLVCLFLAAQSAGLVSANEQHHSQDHCCLLCHVGPLPFVSTNVASMITPAFSVVWLAVAPELIPTHDVLPAPCSSRAPPA